MVMQDVNHQLFTESVRDEVTLNIPEKQSEQAENILRQMGIARTCGMSSAGAVRRTETTGCHCKRLVCGKKILIYDEPTSGLDYESMRCACAFIRQVSRQAELSLVITHDLEFIMSAALVCCILTMEQSKHFIPLTAEENKGEKGVSITERK